MWVAKDNIDGLEVYLFSDGPSVGIIHNENNKWLLENAPPGFISNLLLEIFSWVNILSDGMYLYKNDLRHFKYAFPDWKERLSIVAQCDNVPDGIRTLARDALSGKYVKDQKAKAALRKVTQGYIYLAKSNNGHYKIGRTTDPEKRLKQLQSEYPMLEISMEHTFSAMDFVTAEDELQQRYNEKCVGREWFALAPDDVETISSISGWDGIFHE
jgi:hypothetical protein